ncbi:nicotinate-nucleotide diphosphorylase (carboxylating) [archaeon SCG-AAA382B04]|nr:nicotinate-nucleotide diphosphorylase (carboxylating) [archaeon SCG-AAA382B04]
MVQMLRKDLERFIEEDLPYGDVTTRNVVDEKEVTAKIHCNQKAVLSGTKEAIEVFKYFDLEFEQHREEGEVLEPKIEVFDVFGDSRDILKSERLVLNFLTKMSAISTKTRKAIEKAKKINPEVKVAGTRKTTPGFREFEKRAIKVGGGEKHRMNLSDSVLIKDNHIKIMGFEEVLNRLKNIDFTKKVEVEVEDKEQANKAISYPIDILMLDNFSPKEVEETLDSLEPQIRKDITIEVSGGITLENIREYAGKDVDIISMGSLAHSVDGVDFSLEIIN